MHECNYCSESFGDSDETEYLQHMVDEHEDSLSRIDTRRIENHPEVTLGPTYETTMFVLQGIIILAILTFLGGVMYWIVTSDAYGAAMGSGLLVPGLF